MKEDGPTARSRRGSNLQPEKPARGRRGTTYLVERSLPVLSEKHRATLQEALAEASRRLTSSGSPVRYLGSTFVPARSRCFCVFEATSLDVVRAVNEAALVPYVAINEAIEARVASFNRTMRERVRSMTNQDAPAYEPAGARRHRAPRRTGSSARR